MEFYCYLYRDPSRDNEPIYIGKGKGQRSHFHLKPCARLKTGTRNPFYNRLNKMVKNGTEPVIEFLAKGLDEELAFLVEVEAIEKYGRRDLNRGTLLNKTNGGDGCSGIVISEGQRKAISAYRSGRKTSDETRRRMSLAHGGSGEPKTRVRRKPDDPPYRMTPEHKAALSAAMKAKRAAGSTPSR